MAPLSLRAQCLVMLAAASPSAALVSTHGSLVEWLSAIPGCVIGPVHVKTSLLGAGRGMVLSRSVLKDEELLVIPRAATISSRTAEADPVLGSELAKLCEAEGERAALAGYLAHQLLNCESETAFLPYVSTLPTRLSDASYPLWWSEEEVELLRGTYAHQELLTLLQEVEDVAAWLRTKVLCSDVERHGAKLVDEAVRAAYVSILSRAFGNAGEPGNTQVLIPLLDMIQHGPNSTVSYSSEDSSSCIVARANADLPAGTELIISYGEHPDFVFGLHFGFVPRLLEQSASCYTVLKLELMGEAMGLGLAEDIALGAQLAADEIREARSGGNGSPWREADIRANPHAALADMLSWCGDDAEYPLQFGLSVEDLDALVHSRAARRSGGATEVNELMALAHCSRLCALAEDGSDDSVEVQQGSALMQLMLSGSIGPINDINAARLVVAAARKQLIALELGHRAASQASPDARSCCVDIALALRRSEEVVLARLCEGTDVGVNLFDIPGFAEAINSDLNS